MQGKGRTIARRCLCRLLVGALLAAALAPTAATAKPPAHLRGAKVFVLPWQTSSPSVAVSPAGVPWFGTSAPGSLSLVSVEAEGEHVTDLDPHHELVTGRNYGSTDSLSFDAEGNLWFVRTAGGGEALVRRAPDGTETTFDLHAGPPVRSLAIGPEGAAWLARADRDAAELESVTPTGTVTRVPLVAGSDPSSITAGPDGALWFTEEAAGKVGRIMPTGEVRLFALGPRVIVAGSEGALWFSENGKRRHGWRSSARIGRITTSGKVAQFPIPFGRGTEKLAADPRGRVWFSTEKGEISSIAPSGAIGARGCPGSCASAIFSLAVAPDGALWFAAEKHYVPCLECGGGTAILQQLEGAPVGELPPGVLRPAGSSS